jgi:hypothetical protein
MKENHNFNNVATLGKFKQGRTKMKKKGSEKLENLKKNSKIRYPII